MPWALTSQPFGLHEFSGYRCAAGASIPRPQAHAKPQRRQEKQSLSFLASWRLCVRHPQHEPQGALRARREKPWFFKKHSWPFFAFSAFSAVNDFAESRIPIPGFRRSIPRPCRRLVSVLRFPVPGSPFPPLHPAAVPRACFRSPACPGAPGFPRALHPPACRGFVFPIPRPAR